MNHPRSAGPTPPMQGVGTLSTSLVLTQGYQGTPFVQGYQPMGPVPPQWSARGYRAPGRGNRLNDPTRGGRPNDGWPNKQSRPKKQRSRKQGRKAHDDPRNPHYQNPAGDHSLRTAKGSEKSEKSGAVDESAKWESKLAAPEYDHSNLSNLDLLDPTHKW